MRLGRSNPSSPACFMCRHYPGSGRACAAFPEGIPGPIFSRLADHRLAFDGDGGLRFEPRPDLDPVVVADAFAADDALRRRVAAAMEV